LSDDKGFRIGVSLVKNPFKKAKYLPEIIDVYPNKDPNPGIAMVIMRIK
jgi:hypothetical protein